VYPDNVPCKTAAAAETIEPASICWIPRRLDFVGFFTFSLVLVALKFQSTASEMPAANPKTMLVLGDSLAAGYGLDPSESYPAVLQKKIKEAGWNITVINAGLSGDTTAGGLRRLDWVLKRKVDVLLLELGGNDGLRGNSVEAMKTNLQTIIEHTKQKYPDVQIVIAGMRMPPNLGAYAAQFDKVFPDLAQKNQATLVPFLLEGVAGKPELNQPDAIHPTAAGQKILSDNLWKVLRPLLARMAGGQINRQQPD
jgi:acyl-CoA thioesterase-1